MRYFLAVSFLSIVISSSAWARLYAGYAQVAVGDRVTVAFNGDGIACPLEQPNYIPIDACQQIAKLVTGRIKMISAGPLNVCAIDEQGLKCLGQEDGSPYKIPALKNPRFVSVGIADICAIDDEGVKCWGDSSAGQLNVPPLKNPRWVSASAYPRYQTCAIDDNRVHCWGGGMPGWDPVIGPMNDPRAVIAGPGMGNCILDGEGGVNCFDGGSWDAKFFKNMKNPQMFSLGARGTETCAIDKEGVACSFGSRGPDYRKIKNPTSISIGGFNELGCVTGDEGIFCWDQYQKNLDIFPPVRLPSLDNPHFHLDQSAVFLGLLAKSSSPLRESVLTELQKFTQVNLSASEHSDTLSASRYLLLKLMSPVVLSMSSEIYRQAIIPAFHLSMGEAEGDLGISGISQVSDTLLNRRIALAVLKAEVKAAMNILPAGQQNLIEALRLIGQAEMNPVDKENTKALLAKLDSLASEKAKLALVEKSAFLVPSMELAASWLIGNQ
jgi:hypothetical protein